MQPQIVHESEVHRQHVRLKIPITVEIDGTRFQVDDWSLGGFGIESTITSRQPGESFPVRVTFPFEDFEVTLRLDCQLVYIVDDNKRFGCRFLRLAQGQLSLFRYLVDAYLSGEVVSAGDILSIRGRDNTAEARSQQLDFDPYKDDDSTGRKAKRYAGLGALGLVGLLLIIFVGLGIKDRFFTTEAESAVIEVPVVRLRASASGVLRAASDNEMMAAGETVATIRDAEGAVVDIESPCACVLLDWLIPPGQYVQVGEPIAALVAADKPLLVRAQVSFDQVMSLEVGDRADIYIPGRDGVQQGQIDRIDLKPRLAALIGDRGAMPVSQRMAQVIVRPDKPFEFEDLGSLVRVRFP